MTDDLVVFVPGLFGSELVGASGRPVWALRPRAVLAHVGQFRGLPALPPGLGDGLPGDGIRAGGLLLTSRLALGLISGAYDQLHKRLLKQFGAGVRYFTYDWRLSHRRSAQLLAEAVEGWLSQWRRAGHPGARVVLLCHAEGGLVGRYFAEVLGGEVELRALITVGTPYLGMLKTTEMMLRQDWPSPFRLGEAFATWPSAQQLLPTYPCVHQDGRLLSLTEATVSGLPRGAAADAARFLDEIAPRPGRVLPYRFHIIAGTFRSTPETLAPDGTTWRVRTSSDAGDGIAPLLSTVPEAYRAQADVTLVPAGRGDLLSNAVVLAELTRATTAQGPSGRPAAEPLGLDLPSRVPAQHTMPVAAVSGRDEGFLRMRVTAPDDDEVRWESVLVRSGPDGRFEGTLRFPDKGRWRVRVESCAFEEVVELEDVLVEAVSRHSLYRAERHALSLPGFDTLLGTGADDPPSPPAPSPPPPVPFPVVPPVTAVLDQHLPQTVRVPTPDPPTPTPPSASASASEQRRLVAELAQQAASGREVPLHVQVVCNTEAGPGAELRAFDIPADGIRLHLTVHAPGLVALGDLQQELTVRPGRDSDVVRFGLRTAATGLHQVTTRAFHGGTFLGEVRCQISVEHDGPTRDGRTRTAPLPSMAFEPGEVTLQVLEKDPQSGTYTFQLLSSRCHAPEVFSFRSGNPRRASEEIFKQLTHAAAEAAAGRPMSGARLRRRLRAHGAELWRSAVPEAVQRQFWEEADRIATFTVLGAQDIVPWELLFPLNEGHEERGFLAEWLPIVRRVFGQERATDLSLDGAAFVVPPGSPADALDEVKALRAGFGTDVVDRGVFTDGEALVELIEHGYSGLLHFACHNSFGPTGSTVKMADGAFDPIDLAAAIQLRSLRPHHPLVFFNACRSAGEIDWFGSSLGWAPQFMRAGAGAFVGTLWPVRSSSALLFADAFYQELIVDRRPLGAASLAARQAITDQEGDPTWLAYAVYGNPAAVAATSYENRSSIT
ncbi:CHAT domain-containing protein [Streptomyces sp. NPDC059752]|uniref:CHAT domain-containing protein n=1 Tax=unclassified Streptomyces TaxID=2593676 RepID=UPI00365AD65B